MKKRRLLSHLSLLVALSAACVQSATPGGGPDSGDDGGQADASPDASIQGGDAAETGDSSFAGDTRIGPPDATGSDSGRPMLEDSGGPDSGTSSGCAGAAPATVTLPAPSGASGTWVSTANGGALTNLPHSTAGLACGACHLACSGPNDIIGYDHSNPAFVCNYCHDPGTKIVTTSAHSGSMANYHSSSDSQVCTCCHNGTNNAANGLAAAPGTPIVPSAPGCSGTSAWPLVYPTYQPATQEYSGGQFFGNE